MILYCFTFISYTFLSKALLAISILILPYSFANIIIIIIITYYYYYSFNLHRDNFNSPTLQNAGKLSWN